MGLSAAEHAVTNTDCETIIGPYKVTLEFINDGGDIVSQCGVDLIGTGIGSSLGCLMGFGTLEDYETGNEHQVSEKHRDEIIDWAENHGY